MLEKRVLPQIYIKLDTALGQGYGANICDNYKYYDSVVECLRNFYICHFCGTTLKLNCVNFLGRVIVTVIGS